MDDIVLVDYTYEVDLPNGAALTHGPDKKISFFLNEILLLKLSANPGKPPYFNFSDMNAIWRFANSHSSDVFLDVWMASAIALKSRSREMWKDFSCIFCPGTIIPMNGSGSWIMPVLEREDGNNIWLPKFVSNCHLVENKVTSAIGYIRNDDIFGVAPLRL